MKRKKVVLLGCMAMLMACSGCGNTKLVETEAFDNIMEQVEESTKSVDEGTGESQSQTQSEPVGELAEQDSSKMPQIEMEHHKKEWKSDDGEQILFTLSYDTVKVLNQGYDALQTAISVDFSDQKDLADDAEELEWARNDYEHSKEQEESYFYGYDSSEYVNVERCDERVVSLTASYSGYTGGAHGYYGTTGYNYDVQKGSRITLSDIVENEEEFSQKAISYINQELENQYEDGLFPEYRETVEASVKGENQNYWYLNGTGIVFVFNPYEVGPYAMGQAFVTLPYEEFGQYIKAEYRNGTFVGTSSISANADLSEIIGVNQPVMLKKTCVDKEYYEYEYAVVSGEQTYSLGQFNDYMRSYILRRSDGRCFLFVSFDYASADYISYVFELTDGAIRMCQEVNNICFTGTALSETRIEGSFQTDILGTYGAKMEFKLLEDGTLQEVSEVCKIDSYYYMTVMRELPVWIDGKEEMLPVGTKLTITATDRANTAYFETMDGVKGKIEVTRDEENFGFLIHGISENEYFDMVPYAG